VVLPHLGILVLLFKENGAGYFEGDIEFPHATLSLDVPKLLEFFVGQGVPTLDSSSLGGVNGGD
jgi:hypothetical protein